MSEHLTRYFTAAHRIRRSNQSLVRSGAAMDLQDLKHENLHPRIRSKIDGVLNEHITREAKAS